MLESVGVWAKLFIIGEARQTRAGASTFAPEERARLAQLRPVAGHTLGRLSLASVLASVKLWAGEKECQSKAQA